MKPGKKKASKRKAVTRKVANKRRRRPSPPPVQALQPDAAGRPPTYDPGMAELARKFCQMGATNFELADALGVAERTIYRWQVEYPEFAEALKIGKDIADDRVERSLYSVAVGYDHKSVKIFADSNSGKEKLVEYVEHFPPDKVAAFFWLKNRRRKEWRESADAGVGINLQSGVLVVPGTADQDSWQVQAELEQAELARKEGAVCLDDRRSTGHSDPSPA